MEHGVTGLLVDPGDMLAITEAVLSLARNDELRNNLAEGGRRRVEAGFTTHTCESAIIEVVNGLQKSF